MKTKKVGKQKKPAKTTAKKKQDGPVQLRKEIAWPRSAPRNTCFAASRGW